MKQQEAGRIYIGYEDDPEQERLSKGRYEFALNFIRDGAVCLDAACGSGYGTEILSRKATKVIGLEIDDHALEFARNHYQDDKVSFKKADLTQPTNLPSDYFDVVISIETLEHISNHETITSEFHRVLKPNGLLVLSTVDHEVYSIKGGIRNKHHIGELTKEQLLSLIARYFKLEELYGQLRYEPLSLGKHIRKKLWLSFLIILSKLDIFKVRYRVVKVLHLNDTISAVNEGISTMKLTDIERTDFTNGNAYYQLIVVARK